MKRVAPITSPPVPALAGLKSDLQWRRAAIEGAPKFSKRSPSLEELHTLTKSPKTDFEGKHRLNPMTNQSHGLGF